PATAARRRWSPTRSASADG
ncbi:hypothetical protein STRIP9103_06301, partial [Streptomyces ipomoeae 91-03]